MSDKNKVSKTQNAQANSDRFQSGTASDDTLVGDEGSNRIQGLEGGDLIQGLSGNDHLHGNDGNDVLEGGEGNDQLAGGEGDDVLSGGEGNDKLSGGGGADYFDGGTGNDVLLGEDGSDAFVWRAGDGNDGIYGGMGNDALTLVTSDTDFQTIRFTLDPDGNLLVKVEGGNGGNLLLNSIESFDFQFGPGGAALVTDDLPEGFFAEPFNLSGGDGDDTIDASGSTEPTTIEAGGGDDEILSGSGNDSISGGQGDDSIDAGAGDDTILWQAGDGSDRIEGGEGDDTLDFSLATPELAGLSVTADANGNVILTTGDTQVTLSGVEEVVFTAGDAGANIVIGDLSGTDISQNTLYFVGGSAGDYFDAGATDRRIHAQGNDGNDTLISGSANDYLDGGAGNDFLDGGRGSGVDTLLGGAGNDSFATTLGDEQDSGAVDIVDGGSDSDQLTVTFVELVAHDLLFELKGNGDGSFSIVSKDIDVNETLTASSIENLHLVAGEGALQFVLGSLADTSLAQNGVNFTGSGAEDSFDGSGTDVRLHLEGHAGADALQGGSRDDFIAGGAGNDSLSGGGGSDFLAGGEGDDVLSGGEGFDHLSGGAGSDTLIDTDGMLSGDAGADFLNGLPTYEGDGAGVLVNLSSSVQVMAGMTIGVRSGRDGYGDIDSYGTGAVNLHASHHDDVAIGSDEAQYFFLRAGNDTIDAGAGNDTIFAGSGNDAIDGGDGFDMVHYADDGYDGAGPAAQGVIVDLSAGTASDGFGGTDTLIRVEGASGSALEDDFTGDDADNRFVGLGGNDVLRGGAGQDFLAGSDGNDLLEGGAGDDLLFGGAGDDEITGGDGKDVFGFYSALDGATNFDRDTILDFSVEEDVLDFRPFTGLGSLADVQAMASDDGTDTTISVAAGKTLVLAGVTVAQLVESNFLFASTTPPLNEITGTSGNEVLTGTAGADHILGLEGNDGLNGMEGDDVLDGGSGMDRAMYINDTAGVTVDLAAGMAVDGWGGHDDLISIEGAVGSLFNDVLLGDGGNNILFGLAGDDLLQGGDGFDILLGGTGDDHIENPAGGGNLQGHDGNDVIIGGQGWWDNIQGNAGDDVLIDPDGSGMLNGGEGNDSLDGRPSYATDPGGVFVNLSNTAWDALNDGTKVLAARTALDGFGGTDTLLAGAVDMHASAHDDFVKGSEFGQFFELRSGNDVAHGEGGDDNFRGGSGQDFLDGGAGFDNVDYQEDGFDSTPVIPATGAIVNLSSSDFTYDFKGMSGVIQANSGVDSYGNTDQIHNIEAVHGSLHDDIIIGGSGHNWLWGNTGDDYINGGGEGDNLIGHAGNDILDGGEGDWDTAWYHVFDPGMTTGVHVDLALGTALDGFGTTDTLINIDNVEGSQYADVIHGDAANNFLAGNEGDDKLYGREGNDALSGRDGDDQAFGEGGDDHFDASAGNDLLDGGDGRDHIGYEAWNGTTSGINVDLSLLTDAGGYTGVAVAADGAGGEDYIRGVENITGSDHDDTIIGDAADNGLSGAAGADVLHGGLGDDWLDGGDDNDVLDGGEGFDNLMGGENDDTLLGGAGDDFLVGGSGMDTLDGGDGWDHVAYDSWTGVLNGVNVDLSLAAEQVQNDGWGDKDTLIGIEGISGSDQNDILRGDDFGNGMHGNGGADILDGRGGFDWLAGGEGDDLFVFATGYGHDTVEDFAAGMGSDDVIDLAMLDGVADFTALMNMASEDEFGNTFIDFGNGDMLTLLGTGKDSLHEDDFLFA